MVLLRCQQIDLLIVLGEGVANVAFAVRLQMSTHSVFDKEIFPSK